MDAKGPTAKAEEVEEYLRNLGAHDWGASLDVAVLPRKKKATRAAAKPTEPQPKAAKAPPRPKAEEKPKPQLRDAKPGDAKRLVELIHELGHEVTEAQVRKNLTALKKLGEAPLLATLGNQVVGLIGVHTMVTVHRASPVGRIPVLVVAKEAQGLGLGRMLVDAAEHWCRKQGCQLIEVTSNDRRAEAHAFYRHMGYERTSIRFFKKL
jgi:GNAT superfamily N-acetyltransferase